MANRQVRNDGMGGRPMLTRFERGMGGATGSGLSPFAAQGVQPHDGSAGSPAEEVPSVEAAPNGEPDTSSGESGQ